MTPSQSDPGGVWNVYVAAGQTAAERRARLAEAPEHWRPSIEAHVRLVFKIRARQRAWRADSQGARQ